MENNSTSVFYLINLLLKFRKSFLYVLIASSLIGIFIAFLLPVKYKSEGIFYPLSTKTYDPRYLFYRGDVYLFGSGDDADRIVSLGESSEITWYIINKYDLGTRYGLDKTDKLFPINVLEKFRKNYSIGENDFSAITVTILDPDPDTAAIIANDIIDRIDYLNRKPLVETCTRQLEKYEKDLNVTYKMLDSLFKRTDYKKSLMPSEFQELTFEHIRITKELQESQTRLSLLKQDFNTLHIIEKAAPSIKKASPIRWLVVLTTVLGSLLSFAIIVIVLDQVKKNVKLS